jgi:hypothetical protein
MSNAHEHLEHAEHAGHAADPFDRRVAVSVAVVAALLAGISMLGHRKHNEVLQIQGDANRLTTEASILHTQATDKWGEYQAVNVRDHGYEFSGKLLGEISSAKPDLAPAFKTSIDRARDQHGKYDKRLPELRTEAEKLGHSGADKQKESLKKMDDAHHAHEQANRLDFGHLGAEIGIVLCSLALLTKRKVFWLTGLLAAALAIGLVASAYIIQHHEHDNTESTGSRSHGH